MSWRASAGEPVAAPASGDRLDDPVDDRVEHPREWRSSAARSPRPPRRSPVPRTARRARTPRAVGRIVAKPERTEVEPRKVGRVGQIEADGWQLGVKARGKVIALAVEVRPRLGEPRLPVVQAANVASAPGEPTAPNTCAGSVFIARSTPAWPKCATAHRRPARLKDLLAALTVTVRAAASSLSERDRDVVAPGMREVGPDLVADDQQVVLLGDLGDRGELFARRTRAGRVVRIAQQYRSVRASTTLRAAPGRSANRSDRAGSRRGDGRGLGRPRRRTGGRPA